MAITPIKYYGKITPTGVDPSEARKYQALAGLADQVGDISFAVGKKIRTEQGQKAGLEAGITAAEDGTPVESKSGLLSQFSIFDQAYNTAMESAYVASIDQDARENISRIAAENPDNIEAFTASSSEYTKGVLGNVSEEYQPIIAASIESVLSVARTQVQTNEIATNIVRANEVLGAQAQTALEDVERFSFVGETDSADIAKSAAFQSIDARTDLSPQAKEDAKKSVLLAANYSTARGGMKQIISTQGAMGAVEFIERISEGPMSDMSIAEQDTLVNVLRGDLSEHLSLENAQDAQQNKALTTAQNINASDLFVRVLNGEAGQTDINLASGNKDISFTQTTQLTSALTNRGSGTDDYSFIRQVNETMQTNPSAALLMIENAAGVSLTDATASQLYTSALSARDSESPLNSGRAKRFRTFLADSVKVVGPMGAIDFDSQKRLAQLEVVYDERLLAGEDPAVIAAELIDVNDFKTAGRVMFGTIDNIAESRTLLSDAFRDGSISEDTYNREFYKLDDLEEGKALARQFEDALKRSLQAMGSK